MEALIRAAKGDPSGCYDMLMKNNPQFRQFMEDNQGKTPQQIASEHGIDLNSLGRLMK